MSTITLNNEELYIVKKQYSNKRIALLCMDNEGITYATLSVNLINEEIGENEVFLDINNVPGVESALSKAGIIDGLPVRYAQSGYCEYPLYKINL